MIELRPYEAKFRIGLADAYQKAAECIDIEDRQARSRAEFFLDQAIAQLGELPSEMRNAEKNVTRSETYRAQLEELLEKDEG